ncbi:ATP-grasp domain-containing protein [Actinoplanes subtropicus]|uniref:ATP-grasp domain-containing protein n=1 Tax=Actinoplanes subtropicus TaxID=543632 RepID=UPI000ABE5BEB|nr:ATP-grasp domain-containing protein [Actinoplanes subtropicus]
MASLPRVGVVLNFGAATPLSILAAARGLCKVVFLCDRNLPYVASALDELTDFAEVHDITGVHTDPVAGLGLAGIVTFSEAQIRRTADIARHAGLSYLSPSAAVAVTDKYVQRTLLRQAGVPGPRFHALSGPADLPAALTEVGLPAVLKPRAGAGSAYTCRVDSLSEASGRLSEFPPGEFVLEDMLPGDPSVAGSGFGDYVSVESVIVAGRVRHVEVTGKFPLAPPFRETGYVVPSTLSALWRHAVLEAAEAAVRALGVTVGVTHVEVKLTPNGPRVIEVNGRLGGYVADLVRRARGIDLVRLSLSACLGHPVYVPEPVYRRCAFQYFLTAPMDAGVLRRLDGVEQLSRRPGIQHVEVFRQAGDRLDWRRGTLGYLGIVYGSATDHAGVLNLIATIDETLATEVA